MMHETGSTSGPSASTYCQHVQVCTVCGVTSNHNNAVNIDQSHELPSKQQQQPQQQLTVDVYDFINNNNSDNIAVDLCPNIVSSTPPQPLLIEPTCSCMYNNQPDLPSTVDYHLTPQSSNATSKRLSFQRPAIAVVSVSIDEDENSQPKPPTPPPRRHHFKSSSFRRHLSCLSKQESADICTLGRTHGCSLTDLTHDYTLTNDLPNTPPTPPTRSSLGLGSLLPQLSHHSIDLKSQPSGISSITSTSHGSYSAPSSARSRSGESGDASSSPRQRPRAMSNVAASLRFIPVPAMAVAGLFPESSVFGSRGSPLRASYHGKASEKQYMPVPGTIDKRSMEVVGSAESLVGRVLQEQGLGKFCDPGFLRATQREIAEAFNMTPEELDRAAHRILEAERKSSPQLLPPSSPVLNQQSTSTATPNGTTPVHQSNLNLVKGGRTDHVGRRGGGRQFEPTNSNNGRYNPPSPIKTPSSPSEDEDEDKYKDTKL